MIHQRRDNRAATIDDVVVVIEDVDGRDGAAHGDDYARRRTTAEDDPFLCPCCRSARACNRSLLCRRSLRGGGRRASIASLSFVGGGRRTRRPCPPREDGGDLGVDVVARIDGRRDDRAAIIDVVVVIEDVDGRDGAERGDNNARQRTMDDV